MVFPTQMAKNREKKTPFSDTSKSVHMKFMKFDTSSFFELSADPGRRKGERVREEDGRKGLAAASRHVCLRGSSSIEQEEQQQK